MPTMRNRRPERRDRFRLDSKVVAEVVKALGRQDRSEVVRLTKGFHSADFADLIEQIKPDSRKQIVGMLGRDLAPRVLSDLEKHVRDEVLGYFDTETLVYEISKLDSGDAVYLLEDLDAARRQEILDSLAERDRVAVENSLSWPDGSAGRMMQSETGLVAAPDNWTVGQVIDRMREAASQPDERKVRPRPFHQIIVVDARHRPVGMVPLGHLLGRPRDDKLKTIQDSVFHAVKATDDKEDVAYAFSHYHLVSAPVVDRDGRLVGFIAIEDAVDALDDEAEDDMHKLGGVGEEEVSDSVLRILKRRIIWLSFNLFTAVLASYIIFQFESVIDRVVSLAILMPIVASMGGNGGTQSLTVAVRALATRTLTRANAGRVIGREAGAGLINGLLFAVIVGVAAYVWYGDLILGTVMGAAMLVTMLAGALAGILVPLSLRAVGWDPALASGTLVSTATDIVGFFMFLYLATVFLV